MINRIIIIGGSAGSLHAVFSILGSLNPGFSFPILLVLHRQNTNDSTLIELLAGKTDLKVREIEEKDMIQPGFLYICPADYHVLVEEDESFSLDVSEKIHFSRPSLDVVFQSAADVFGNRSVGIVLSGANRDGADGLAYIKEKGGFTLIQNPSDAQVPYMPEQAIQRLTPDHLLTASGIGEFLNKLQG